MWRFSNAVVRTASCYSSIRNLTHLQRICPNYVAKFDNSLPYNTWWEHGEKLSTNSDSNDITNYLMESMELYENHDFIIDSDHISKALEKLSIDAELLKQNGVTELVLGALNRFKLRDDIALNIFNNVCDNARLALGGMKTSSLVPALEEMASLHVKGLVSPRMSSTIFDTVGRRCVSGSDLKNLPTAEECSRLIKAHSKCQISSDHIESILNFASRQIGGESQNIRPLTADSTVNLLFSAIATRQFNSEFITTYMNHTTKLVNLSALESNSETLKRLKFIESTIRLELPQTARTLQPHVVEFFALIRKLAFVDNDINRQTPCSIQLKTIMKTFGMNCKPIVEGPFGIRLADPERRIAVEVLEFGDYFPNSDSRLRFWPASKLRQLELCGWRVIKFSAREWKRIEREAIDNYDRSNRSAYHRKLNLVRSRLLSEGLIDGAADAKSIEAAQLKAAAAIAKRQEIATFKAQSIAKSDLQGSQQ